MPMMQMPQRGMWVNISAYRTAIMEEAIGRMDGGGTEAGSRAAGIASGIRGIGGGIGDGGGIMDGEAGP